jgi:hypothetical protein
VRARNERLGDVALPDFLLVGAAKSATTSLYYYLSQHPEIRMSSIKENWFFSFMDSPPKYASPGVLSDVVTRLDEYVRLFDGARPEQRLGDASPSYLYTYRDTIRNIRSVYSPEDLKRLRIIISLRDPVSRAFSQYWTFKRRIHEPLSFEEAVDESAIARRLSENWNIFYDYIGFGRYHEQVKAYLDAFGRDRVLIFLYDDFRKDPIGVCQSIFAFLGIDANFVPDMQVKYNDLVGEPRRKWLWRVLTSRNPVKRAFAAVIKRILLCLPQEPTRKVLEPVFRRLIDMRRSEMMEQTRMKLVRGFSDDNRRLEDLIGRDLSHWRGGA